MRREGLPEIHLGLPRRPANAHDRGAVEHQLDRGGRPADCHGNVLLARGEP